MHRPPFADHSTFYPVSVSRNTGESRAKLALRDADTQCATPQCAAMALASWHRLCHSRNGEGASCAACLVIAACWEGPKSRYLRDAQQESRGTSALLLTQLRSIIPGDARSLFRRRSFGRSLCRAVCELEALDDYLSTSPFRVSLPGGSFSCV